MNRRGGTLLLGTGLALALACGGSGPPTHAARGEVREVYESEKQALIAHEEIPGLMPAMTMSFDVPDPKVLAQLVPGQRVRFTLTHEGNVYRIVAVEPEGEAGASGSNTPPPRSALAAARDPAPPFRLVVQDGRPVSLEDLRGRAVVLDFIFTHCPGPCPTLTGLQKDVRKALSPEQRARVRFVSITLDPERDTPEALRAYAETRGVDLEGWSFLTGPADEVNAVVRAYGVGVIRREGQEPEHLVATFVIDAQGQIASRILGLDPPVEERVKQISAVIPRSDPPASGS